MRLIKISVIIFLIVPIKMSAQQKETPWILEECINYALENNTSIKRSENNTDNSRINLSQSKSNQGANLIASINQNNSYGYNYSNASNSWSGDMNNNISSSIGSSITLYNGAKLKNAILQNELYLCASENEIETQVDNTLLKIMQDYVNVLLSKKQLETAEKQLEITKKQLELAEEREKIGIISEADLLDMKSQYASNKADIATAKNNFKIKSVFLMQDMNMPIIDNFTIVEPDLEEALKNSKYYSAEEVFQIAVGIKTEIKTAQLELEGSILGVDLAKADYLPKLSMSANIGTGYYSNSTFDFNTQFGRNISPTIGFSVSIPIYQKKTVSNNIAKAKISINNSELNLIDTKNSLRKAIEQAVVDASSAYETYNARTEQLNAENASYNVAEEKFNQGMMSTVDYLIRKNALFNTEIEHNRSQYNLLLQNKIVDYYLGNSILF